MESMVSVSAEGSPLRRVPRPSSGEQTIQKLASARSSRLCQRAVLKIGLIIVLMIRFLAFKDNDDSTHKNSNSISDSFITKSSKHSKGKIPSGVSRPRTNAIRPGGDNTESTSPNLNLVNLYPEDRVTCPPLADLYNCSAARRKSKVSCQSCLGGRWPNNMTLASSQQVDIKLSEQDTIYMPILVPPYWGSSMLENILSSSPMVTNMCKNAFEGTERDLYHIPWQCESTWVLTAAGAMLSRDRWNPKKANFTLAYEVYHKYNAWVDKDAPIKLDKAPPNIAKVKEMMSYFKENNVNFRAIIMLRHPCRKEYSQKIRSFIKDVFTHIPADKRFFIDYDELLLNPKKVTLALLEWLPAFQYFTLDTSNLPLHTGINGKVKKMMRQKELKSAEKKKKEKRASNNIRRRLEGMHLQTTKDYVLSEKCSLKYEVPIVESRGLVLWDHFKKLMDAQYKNQASVT